MKGSSITTKLRYIITAACLAAIFLTTSALLVYQWTTYTRDAPNALILRARILALNAGAALAFKNVGDATEILNSFHLDPAVTCAVIFDEDGAIFASYNLPAHQTKTIPVRKALAPEHEITQDQITIWAPIEMQGKHLGTLAFSRSLRDLTARLRLSMEIAVIVMLVTAGFAFWLSHLLQGVVSAPILKLTALARRVTENNDFEVATEINTDGEIGVLSSAFAQMLRALRERDQKIRSHAGDLEQKVAERTELLANTNRDLQMFGYSVSHDLRAPLRSILGYTEMLAETEGSRLTEEGRGYLTRVQKNAGKMEDLIESLLRFSRLDKNVLVKSRVDMAAIVKEVVEDLRFQSKDRNIQITIDPMLPEGDGEPALVRQVWANLIGNAFKFTQARNPASIIIGGKMDPGSLNTYFVQDNGVGFDMQHASKLFMVFERLHSEGEFEGSGIGLATVQRILQRHNGRIWAEAKSGEGATFYFSL